MSVMKDLNGGVLSREGIEAVRYVYPNLYAEIQHGLGTADLIGPSYGSILGTTVHTRFTVFL